MSVKSILMTAGIALVVVVAYEKSKGSISLPRVAP